MAEATLPPSIDQVDKLLKEHEELDRQIQAANKRKLEIAAVLVEFASAVDCYIDEETAEFVVRGRHVKLGFRRHFATVSIRSIPTF